MPEGHLVQAQGALTEQHMQRLRGKKKPRFLEKWKQVLKAGWRGRAVCGPARDKAREVNGGQLTQGSMSNLKRSFFIPRAMGSQSGSG